MLFLPHSIECEQFIFFLPQNDICVPKKASSHEMHLTIYPEHVQSQDIKISNNETEKIVFEEIIYKLIDWAFHKVF